MAQFRFKSETLRTWLQYFVGPVMSVWVAASIADSRGIAALAIGLALGCVLAGSVYVLARKIKDEFLLAGMTFVTFLVGAGALASLDGKLNFGAVSISLIFVVAVPSVLSVLFAARRLGWENQATDSDDSDLDMIVGPPTAKDMVNPLYPIKFSIYYREVMHGDPRDR